MEAISSLLILIGMLVMLVSFVSLLSPVAAVGLPTRKRSALVLLLSFCVALTGGSLVPDMPEEPPAPQALNQAAPELPPQAEATDTTGDPDVPPKQASEPVAADRQPVIDGDAWMGCSERDYYEKLITYAVQRDREAWSRARMEGLLSGECVMFTAGEPVFIADTTIFSGLVKVRRKGKLAEYWTATEAVTH